MRSHTAVAHSRLPVRGPPAPPRQIPKGVQASPERGRESPTKRLCIMGGLAARPPLPSRPSVERNPDPASRSCSGRWVPAAHLRAWRLQSQLRVPAPTRLPLRAPTLLAPQPLAQPPLLGKTKPGGGGGPGLRDRLHPRSPPRLPVRGFKEGDEGDRGCAPSAGGDKRTTRPVKVRGFPSVPPPWHPLVVPYFA